MTTKLISKDGSVRTIVPTRSDDNKYDTWYKIVETHEVCKRFEDALSLAREELKILRNKNIEYQQIHAKIMAERQRILEMKKR
jgi:hypothetical protein